LMMPVSSNGVIQREHLVNRSLLAATEHAFDERNRLYQVDRLLFVNTIPTMRSPDVADGATDIGKGNLTPNDTQSIPGVDGVNLLGRVTARTEYDRNARPVFHVADDGDTTRTYYDGVGRSIQSIDPEGNRAAMAYDDNSNLIETQEIDVAQRQDIADERFVTTYFYDSLNRLQRSVNNVGETFAYRYDSRDNMVAMADAQGPINGASITRRVFGGGSRTVNQINNFGNVTIMVYDGIGRKLRDDQVLTASGKGDGLHIGVDSFGMPIDLPASDPNQGGGDGLISVRHRYDDNSLLTSLTDDNGNQTEYTYDNLNRKLTETKGTCVAPAIADQCGPPTTVLLHYDADDNLIRITDENGSVINYSHDAINRRTRADIVRGPNVVGTTLEVYTYDGLSRRTQTTDNNEPDDISDDSTATYAYDSLSRVIEETQQIGTQQAKVISSGWRAENLRIGLTYPNRRRLTYTFDLLDRLQTIAETQVMGTMANLIYLPLITNGSEAGVASAVQVAAQPQRQTTAGMQATPLVQYTYIGRVRLLERTMQNHTRMTFLDDGGGNDIGYDGERRPVQLRHLTIDNRLLVGFGYSYDRMGNKQYEEKLHAPSESELYAYDSVYRLLHVERGTLNTPKDAIDTPSTHVPLHSDWTLDGVGNWQVVDNEIRQHSSFNEITERADGGTIAILSDNNGNEIDDGTFTFAWDYRNRLRTATRKADTALVVVYVYDADGRRIRRVVTNAGPLNGTTNFYYDGWRVIEERAGDDLLTQQYTYGGL
ncbi:MAG: RHS repeat protein, partial [Caldilineaceae bacterium]|nr:RHS repeat protein [Caldilineaceae bacterium]